MDSSRHPLEAMVVENQPSDQSPSNDETINKPVAPDKIELEEQHEIDPVTTVDLAGIDRPALLLNSQMKIEWQNAAAKDHIWHGTVAANNGTSSPGIFDLLFDPFFKRQVANFSECLEFFIFQLSLCLTKDNLLKRIQSMDDDRKAMVMSIVEKLDPVDSGYKASMRYLRQNLRNGDTHSFEVMAMNFREGRLVIFERQHPSEKQQRSIVVKPGSERVIPYPRTTKVPYILLAAQLNNAETLRTEMMADEYQRLVSDLCLKCLTQVEHYGGIFGKHVESGFHAYFLLDQDRETGPLRLIECVFEIKDLMVDLGREWKIRKDWLHDIKLNIGLHWEKGYISTIKSSAGEVLTSFGVGLQVAGAISQLGQDGQIWATKALINQIPTQTQRQLRFGILRPDSHRHRAFIRNGFACIKDLFAERRGGVALEDSLTLLPITQIFDRSGLANHQK